RVHRLVGRDQDKSLGAGRQGGFGHVLRAKHVGLDGLFGFTLHKGYMLAGGGMKDDVRPRLLKDATHLVSVTHVGNDRSYKETWILPFELVHHLKHGVFVVIEEDDLAGL